MNANHVLIFARFNPFFVTFVSTENRVVNLKHYCSGMKEKAHYLTPKSSHSQQRFSDMFVCVHSRHDCEPFRTYGLYVPSGNINDDHTLTRQVSADLRSE